MLKELKQRYQLTLGCFASNTSGFGTGGNVTVHSCSGFGTSPHDSPRIILHISCAPILVLLRAGSTSGAYTSNIPEHTLSICILNETQTETNLDLISRNVVPFLTSLYNKATPESKKKTS